MPTPFTLPDQLQDVKIAEALSRASDPEALTRDLDRFLAKADSHVTLELLRFSSEMAFRLDLPGIEAWCRFESEGYYDHSLAETPEYRKPSAMWVVGGHLVRNPNYPVQFYQANLPGGIEPLEKRSAEDYLQISMPEMSQFIQKQTGIVVSYWRVDGGSVRDVIRTVRNLAISFLRRIRRTCPKSLPSAGIGLLNAHVPIHSNVAIRCSSLFDTGHFADAILAGSKLLIEEIKTKSGRTDLDGTGLVRSVFSRKNPVLKVNALSTLAEEDEQEGFMHLLEGITLAVRNPRAHAFWSDTPECAIQLLATMSFLLDRVERSQR